MLRKFFIVLILTIIADVIIAAHWLALTRNILFLAVALGGILPFIDLLEKAWFADAPKLKDRLIITSAISLGVMIGTTITLYLFGAQQQ